MSSGADPADGASRSAKQCSATHAATSAPKPAGEHVLVHDEQPCGAGHRLAATISWSHGDDGAQVDDLDLDARRSASRAAACSDFSTVAPQVTIVRSSPGTADVAPAERDHVVGRRERVAGVGLAQQVLVLEEQHRVLAAERVAQQAGRVAGPRREGDEQPGDVGEDRLAALAVPDRAAGEVAADRHPHHHRAR